MLTPRKAWRRVLAIFGRGSLDSDLDDELAFHLEMEEARLRAAGVDGAEARRQARVAFGGVQRFREETRDARGIRPLDDLSRDIRHGLRTLARRPGFAAVLLLTLAIGVGGSAAIYGAVDGILLTPLPYPDADRVLVVSQYRPDQPEDGGEVAPANFLDWRERSRSFAHLTAFEPYGLDWMSDDGPIYLSTWLVYEGFFETFGTAPLLGRTPRPDEHVQGRGDVVVLGYEVWRTRFGGDSSVVGKVLRLDDRPTTVIGVMPGGFAMPGDDAVWAPKVLAGWEAQARRSNYYTVFGRLRDGVPAAQATAELDGISAQLATEHPTTNSGLGVRTTSLPDYIVGGVRRPMLLLLGAVGLVLAIVVANVASLQLARAAGREREFALRGALGAGRERVGRQLLAENLVIAALGTGLGFSLAHLALAGIRAVAPANLPRVTELKADGDVLLFAFAVSLLATLATGVLPALLASRTRLQASLVDGGRGSTGGRLLGRIQSGLVVMQVSFSLVLLIGAGLLVRSFVTVLGEDRGFRTEGVVTVTVQSWSYYDQPAGRVQFVREVTRRLAALPGVRAAGMASAIPLMETIGQEQTQFAIDGAPPLAASESQPTVNFTAVTPGTLDALGIPLRGGRDIGDADHESAPLVAVVNEAFAKRHFPAGDALGKRIALGRADGATSPSFREIVGVAGDVRRRALSEAGQPAVYLPHAQSPTGANAFVVWGSGPASDLIGRIRQTIVELNPVMPTYRESTMAELVGASVRDRTFLLAILGGFAAMALGLAAAGLLGLMSFATAERTREIGVRMAFGAGRGQVLGLVLRRGTALAGVGIGLGLIGAVIATRVLSGMLYRVQPFDLPTFVVGAAVLLGASVLASWYPAWRAASIDPVRALHTD